MTLRTGSIVATAITLAACLPANAYEFGFAGTAQKPGLTIGGTAGAPPPGIYGFNQAFTYQANFAGPGNTLLNPAGGKTSAQGEVVDAGFLFVPGWTFLGATYDAVLVQAFNKVSIGGPINLEANGVHNTYIVPAELSWRLGDSGVFVKAGFGMYVPSGTTSGVNGLSNIGNPWWTFQPEFVVSYLKDGWNLTANIFQEINTKSTVTGYTSGDILHAEFTATKTIGRWTIGPVAYYVGQVTDDKSSAFYGNTINVNRYDVWAAGGLVGYNFGPATLNVWAFDEFYAKASGGTPAFGIDSATVTKGFSVFASLNYRLWAPDAPAPTRPQLYHK